jgi:hypothetical protein
MVRRSEVRRVVRPIVGENAWQALRDVDRQVRRYRRRRVARLQEERRRRKELAALKLAAKAQQLEQHRAAQELRAMANDLTRLAVHFETDKWGDHRYTPHYQRHLEHLREKPINVLEIGIGGYKRTNRGGASLRMWKHFFPHGQIYGLDINDKSFVEEPRIRAFQGDQSDPELLSAIVSEIGRLDVVIDDGSHNPKHVIASFQTLFPLLADDGLYVIEDIQTSYWPEWGGREDINSPDTSMAMVKRLVDGLNYEEFVVDPYQPSYTDRHVVAIHCYHNLVFIEKGRNEEGTMKRTVLKRRYADSRAR